MNRYRNTPQDIHIRIYKYVVNCFNNVVKKIPKNQENLSIIYQISFSLTSVGANGQEADATLSKKDFILKYSIVKKEIKETIYWLSIIRDCCLIDSLKVDFYIQKGKEILLIVSKIINNSRFK